MDHFVTFELVSFMLAIFCESDPCKNGGTCDPSNHKCLCKEGTWGSFCERGEYIQYAELTLKILLVH